MKEISEEQFKRIHDKTRLLKIYANNIEEDLKQLKETITAIENIRDGTELMFYFADPDPEG